MATNWDYGELESVYKGSGALAALTRIPLPCPGHQDSCQREGSCNSGGLFRGRTEKWEKEEKVYQGRVTTLMSVSSLSLVSLHLYSLPYVLQ